MDILNDCSQSEYIKTLEKIPGLKKIVDRFQSNSKPEHRYLHMEYILHGLAEFSFLSKNQLERGLQFKDLISSMLPLSDEEDKDPFLDEERVN